MHFAVVVVVTAVRQFFGNRHTSKNCQTFGSSSRHILQESCNVLVISYKMLVSKLYCHCPFLPSSIISLNIEYTLKCQTLRNLVHKKQQKRRGLLCGFLGLLAFHDVMFKVEGFFVDAIQGQYEKRVLQFGS